MKEYPKNYKSTRNYHLETFINTFNSYLKMHYLTHEEFAEFTNVKLKVIKNLANGNIKEVSMADYKKILDKIGYSNAFDSSFPINAPRMDKEYLKKIFNS